MPDETVTAIAADLGITGLSSEQQRQVAEQFSIVALKAVTFAVMEKLDGEKREKFMTLAQAGDAQALQAFLDAEVPGHEELAKAAIAGEVTRFKESLAS